MSAIEDTRKLLQDFLAPELRALAVRLDSLEKQVAENDRRAEKRHDDTIATLRQLIDFNALSQRVTRLESDKVAHQ